MMFIDGSPVQITELVPDDEQMDYEQFGDDDDPCELCEFCACDGKCIAVPERPYQ